MKPPAFHREARRDAYDVVVVGSGIGGLTAAALLAHAGRSVLVVERHDRPGGYAHSFKRGAYRFDSAVHLIGGCEPAEHVGSGLVHHLLEGLGVRARVAFERVDPIYRASYPGLVVDAPGGMEAFVEAHARIGGPGTARGLERFAKLCLDVRAESLQADEAPRPFDLAETRRRYPALSRHARATLAEVLAEHVPDPRVASVVATLWPYLGLPPSRVSFLYFATMLVSYVADGAYGCRGTFQRFAEALVEAVEERGGELVTRVPVRRILVEDGRAVGVELEHGQSVRAPVVISNADLRRTVEELVGPERFPRRYRERLAARRLSVSAFVTYLATDLDLAAAGVAHETFRFPGLDHDAAHAGVERGAPEWLTVTVPTFTDPELAPAGEHLAILTTLVPAGGSTAWRVEKDAMVERMIAMAGREIEGLERHVRFAEGGSPRTMERYTLNDGGAIYGWELSLREVGPGRAGPSTPLEGLWLAGHWTRPGGGIYGVVRSGVGTARRILGEGAGAELVHALSA